MLNKAFEKFPSVEGLIFRMHHQQSMWPVSYTHLDVYKRQAENMGISVRTLYRWKNEYWQICHALKKGKDAACLLYTSIYQVQKFC